MRRADEPEKSEDGGPGLPGFRTWRGVYLLVVASFALWVILLTALTKLYP